MSIWGPCGAAAAIEADGAAPVRATRVLWTWKRSAASRLRQWRFTAGRPIRFEDGDRMTAADPSCQYEINAPDVVSEDFTGQIVILNLANGHYFSLGGIASAIWTLILAGHTPRSVFGSIQAKRPELVEPSMEFVARIVELNLVRAREANAGDASSAIDEAWLGDGPQIQVYDDLAELVSADPIHDVDEQEGWPAPRQQR